MLIEKNIVFEFTFSSKWSQLLVYKHTFYTVTHKTKILRTEFTFCHLLRQWSTPSVT